MISNTTTQKISTTRSNKKTIRRTYTEMDEPNPYRKTELSNRDSQRQNSKQKYLDVYSRLNLKETSNPKKVFKVNTHKQPIINKYIRTEPDEPSRKVTGTGGFTMSAKYEVDGIAGKGTFGTVYVGHVRGTGVKIAIKKVLQDKRYKNRELEILKTLHNQNVLEMRDFYLTYEDNKEFLNVVMDYFPYNLYQVIKKKEITNSHIKVLMFQILKGLNYLSIMSIAHRDIKPQNILVDLSRNKSVICDFGSAKPLIHGEPNLAYICSRCYRAPELIFGATDYTTQIDMWSTGCVLVEMINGTPPFLGDSQIDQLIEIIKILGTPSKQEVYEMNKSYDMKEYSKFPTVKRVEWKSMLQTRDLSLIDLVDKMLQYSPRKRLTPAEAMMHEFFDDLRSENTYKNLVIKLKNIPDLFEFSKEELKNFPDPKLVVPKWADSRVYGESNIGRIGSIKTKRPINRLI